MIKSYPKVFWDSCWLLIRSYKEITINIYIYIYKQRSHVGVREVLLSDALILHFIFFLPLSLSFFYCYPKVYTNLFYSYLICHAPNPIPGFVTMTGMLISSLNLILTRANLIFNKTFTKSFLFLFILVSLLKWYNFPLDIQSIYILPQRIIQSTDY